MMIYQASPYVIQPAVALAASFGEEPPGCSHHGLVPLLCSAPQSAAGFAGNLSVLKETCQNTTSIDH